MANWQWLKLKSSELETYWPWKDDDGAFKDDGNDDDDDDGEDKEGGDNEGGDEDDDDIFRSLAISLFPGDSSSEDLATSTVMW